MIRHLVFFKFKPETSTADRDELLAMLAALPSKIAEIKFFEIGQDIVRAPRSFDVGLNSTFENLEALGVYAKHADHLPVVERAKEICVQVASVDYEF